MFLNKIKFFTYYKITCFIYLYKNKKFKKHKLLNYILFYFRANKNECREMSVNEIINGSANSFPGLIPLIKEYLSQIEIDFETHCLISKYLKLIENKANGTCKTTASWMRDFVGKHASYEFDSVVSNEIGYDLMWSLYQISNGIIDCPELNGVKF